MSIDSEASPFAPGAEARAVKPLLCLTLHQPWATLIYLRLKSTEARMHDRWGFLALKNRDGSHVRIGIHAGKTWDKSAIGRARRYVRLEDHPGVGTWRDVERLAKLHAGHLIATAVVICHRQLTVHDSAAALCDCSRDDEGRGLWGFDLDEVRTVEPPIKVTGHQGVWRFYPQGGERGAVL